jgi:hypothetical protein
MNLFSIQIEMIVVSMRSGLHTLNSDYTDGIELDTGDFSQVSILNDGTTVIARKVDNGFVHVFDLDGSKRLFRKHKSRVIDCKFTCDGTVVSISHTQVFVWDPKTMRIVHNLSLGMFSEVICVTKNEPLVYVLCGGGTLVGLNTRTGQRIGNMSFDDPVRWMFMSPDDSCISIWNINRSVSVYERETMTELRRIQLPGASLVCGLSPDSTKLMILDENERLTLVTIADGGVQETQVSQIRHAIKSSSDGTRIICAHEIAGLVIVDATTYEVIEHVRQDLGQVQGLDVYEPSTILM